MAESAKFVRYSAWFFEQRAWRLREGSVIWVINTTDKPADIIVGVSALVRFATGLQRVEVRRVAHPSQVGRPLAANDLVVRYSNREFTDLRHDF